jgi:hypothetical protein
VTTLALQIGFTINVSKTECMRNIKQMGNERKETDTNVQT